MSQPSTEYRRSCYSLPTSLHVSMKYYTCTSVHVSAQPYQDQESVRSRSLHFFNLKTLNTLIKILKRTDGHSMQCISSVPNEYIPSFPPRNTAWLVAQAPTPEASSTDSLEFKEDQWEKRVNWRSGGFMATRLHTEVLCVATPCSLVSLD